MGEFTYENQGTNSYLVYTLSDQEGIDSMSLGMITNNKIPGLAATMFMQMDATKYIKYNVSSKIPVSQFFSGPVTKKRLLGIFEGIVDAVLSAEDYMIDADTILLELDFIYVDVSTCETSLICLPVDGRQKEAINLHLFFKKIMFETQFDQAEDCTYIAKIINYLNGAYQFSLADFKNLLEESKGSTGRQTVETQPSPVASEPGTAAFRQDVPGPVQPGIPVPPPPVKEVRPVQPQPLPQNMAQPQKEVLKQGSLAGMNLPPVQKNLEVLADNNTNNSSGSSDEKPMSLYYLLRHYDKENSELYKRQKEEKKLQKDSQKSEKKSKKKSDRKADKKSQKKKDIPVNIPVPVLPKEAAPYQPPVQQPPRQVTPISVAMQPAIEQPVIRQTSPQETGGSLSGGFGDTVMEPEIDESSETVVFMPEALEQQIRPHLIRKKNGERIPVNKAVFRLGRNFDFNDYVIAENEFIGNSHCHILVKNEEYFIVDDNSKNHTYVDGVMVLPGTKVKLSHGQVIRLANEEFEFRLF